jgi:hypothetical protein
VTKTDAPGRLDFKNKSPNLAAAKTRSGQNNSKDNIMEKERFQFFELENSDPKKPVWQHRFFLDRVTQTVYLPVVDPQTQFIALMDNELTEVNGKPYCRLRLYAEQFPEIRDGLLALEKQLRAAA